MDDRLRISTRFHFQPDERRETELELIHVVSRTPLQLIYLVEAHWLPYLSVRHLPLGIADGSVAHLDPS